MEYWVLGKKQHSNIPPFHHSMYETEIRVSKNHLTFRKLQNFKDVIIAVPPRLSAVLAKSLCCGGNLLENRRGIKRF